MVWASAREDKNSGTRAKAWMEDIHGTDWVPEWSLPRAPAPWGPRRPGLALPCPAARLSATLPGSSGLHPPGPCLQL